MHRIRPEIQAFWAQIFNQARLNRSGWIRFGVLLQDGSLKKVQTVTDDQVDYGPENQLDGAAE
jgi:hypothetical protein